MKRVLLLGAGQVGTFAARALVEQGAFVVAADLQPAPGYFARFGPKESCDLVKADVLDYAATADLIRRYRADTIVLSAGVTGEASSRDPKEAWKDSVDGVKNVALAACDAAIKRVVFVSSFAVYGRPNIEYVSETVPRRPQSEYGCAKAAAEEILISLRDKGLDVRILRPCGTYGPIRLGMGSQSAQFIEALLLGAIKGAELTIEGSTRSADEYIYIKSLGRAIALAATSDHKSSDFIFNVGCGKKTTVADLCAAVKKVVPHAKIRTRSVTVNDRPIPPLDVSRIERVFGFRPRFDLEAGLADYRREAGFDR